MISAAVIAVVTIAARLDPGPGVQQVALFAHLASLVAGFGGVLSVDWVGLQWMLGRRTLRDVIDTAGHCQSLIWVGYAGLVTSSLLLEPDPGHGLTQVKLACVLIIAWNGLLVSSLHQRLLAIGDRKPAPRLIRLAAISGGISQLGWWSAMVIGFINH